MNTVRTAATWLPLLREALAREGRFRFPLRGTSMRPTLPIACEIEIVPPPPRLTLGCLLVFASGDALVAHRLVRLCRDPLDCAAAPQSAGLCGAGWIVHGDGRLAPDRPLQPEQVLGIVAAAYLDGRRIWPGRAEPLIRWFWVARHHALRPARWIRNAIRRIAPGKWAR